MAWGCARTKPGVPTRRTPATLCITPAPVDLRPCQNGPMSEQTRVLYLMRHASADSWGILGDKNRPLTPAGREEAAFIGGQLADSGIQFVVVSAAARTRQTVASMGLGVDVESSDRLYGAGWSTILDIIRELDPACLLYT